MRHSKALIRPTILALSLVIAVASAGSAASTWSRVLAGYGVPRGAAPGPSGGLYVATTTSASGKERHRLYRLAKDGSTVWTRTLSTDWDAGIEGITADASGVYVSMRLDSGFDGRHYQVRKFATNGDLKWKGTTWIGEAEGDGGLISVAGSTVYVGYHDLAGRDLIRRYATSDGGQRSTWTLPLDPQLNPMLLGGFVATTGGVYLASAGADLGHDRIFVTKLDTHGSKAWTHAVGRSGHDLDMGTLSVGSSGVLVTYRDDTEAIRLVRYRLDGTRSWSTKAPGTSTPTGAISGSAAYSATLHFTSGKSGQIKIARYDSSGAIKKTREVGTSGYDGADQIVVSGSYLFLVGTTTTGGSDHQPLVMRVAAP